MKKLLLLLLLVPIVSFGQTLFERPDGSWWNEAENLDELLFKMYIHPDTLDAGLEQLNAGEKLSKKYHFGGKEASVNLENDLKGFVDKFNSSILKYLLAAFYLEEYGFDHVKFNEKVKMLKSAEFLIKKAIEQDPLIKQYHNLLYEIYINQRYESKETGMIFREQSNSLQILELSKKLYFNKNLSGSIFNNLFFEYDKSINLENLLSYFKDYQMYAMISDPDFNNADLLAKMYSEEIVSVGLNKVDQNNYSEAIENFTKALEINPNDDAANAIISSYIGLAKSDLKDYGGAISDLTKAIELNSEYTFAYISRGLAKSDLKDFGGAILDYTKAIELEPDGFDIYDLRGTAKKNLGDLNGACGDWRKAASFGSQNSAQMVRDQCN
jgi:tetratricopeptide (TPR) repeat protein